MTEQKFNSLSTGLCDIVSNSVSEIRSALEIAQPFNDYEEDVNQDFLSTTKYQCELMLELLASHEEIHKNFLEARRVGEKKERLYCFRCHGKVTVSANGYVGCETCGTDQDRKDD